MANAPEMVGAGVVQGVQHRLHVGPQIQVGMADDGDGGPGGTVQAGAAGRPQSLDEFHLAHRPHLLGTLGPVHGPRLNKHGGHDVVAGVYVCGQFFQQVALVGDALRPLVPKVVVRVKDGDFRFKGLFLGQRQPVIASERHNGLLFICQICAGSKGRPALL